MSKKQRHQEKTATTKRRDLRILWNSNSVHSNSGYGVFSRDFLFRAARDGWDIAEIAFWGVQGYPLHVSGEDLIDDRFKGTKLKLYPSMDHPYGSDALVGHALDFKANVVFTMQDVPWLDTQHLSQLKYWVPYVPIDKDPCPANVLDKLRYAYKIVTFSKFGQDTLLKNGFTSKLILEGTDTEIFRPLDKIECRRNFGLPDDAFIFGMVAANKENPPRKGFQEALEAFKMFHANHPDAYIFIHTQQRAPGGFPVEEFARIHGFQDRLLLLHPYQAVFGSDSHQIVKEMNCFDVLLHPSQTEGFGLTVIEAMASGIPAIVNDTTSMPEIIQDGVNGFICQSQKQGRYTNDLSYVYPADVQSLYEKMEESYKAVKEKGTELSQACRDHILKNYSIDAIYENQWKPFLEELQEEVLPLQEKKKDVKLDQSNISSQQVI